MYNNMLVHSNLQKHHSVLFFTCYYEVYQCVFKLLKNINYLMLCKLCYFFYVDFNHV